MGKSDPKVTYIVSGAAAAGTSSALFFAGDSAGGKTFSGLTK